MKNDLDIDMDIGPSEVILLAFIIGAACAAYRYVPFYGATPIAIGMMMLLSPLVEKAWRLVRR